MRPGIGERRKRAASRKFRTFQAAVGDRVATLRKRAGLTQEAASLRASIDIRVWQRLEAGELNATLLTLFDVARALGVRPVEILAIDTR